MDEKNLGAAIRRRRNALKITQTKFAELIGFDGQSSVSRMERGEQPITIELLNRVAGVLDTTPNALWMEAEEHATSGDLPPEYSVKEMVRRVPVVSWVQAGLPNDVFDPYAPGSASGHAKTTVTKFRGKPYALKVRGTSMVDPRGINSFPPGTTIIVDPGKHPENGSLVIVRFEGTSEATFKRLHVDAGKSYLVPMNPQHPTIAINDEATFCGVVVSRAEEELGHGDGEV